MVEMKESGIAWVGDIPFDWEVQKGKYCLKYIEKPVKEDDDVITCFRDGEVTLRKNRREDGFTISEKEIGYQGIDVGDLIVHGMDGFAGAIGISDSRGKASPVLNVLDTTHNKKFIMYYLRNMAYNGVFIALATGIRVRTCDTNWGKLKELPYILPPRQIQDRIVQCIDNRCAEIDAISSEIQEQINTLEEYKKSEITDAVTKGLNPNAEMKDSGAKWIGKIPTSWEIKKGKYCLEYIEKPTKEDDEVITCFRDGEVTLRKNRREDGFTISEKEIGYQGIDVGDLIVHGMDGFAGAIGISDSRGKASPVLNVLGTNQNKQYIMYYLRSMAYNGVFIALATGIRVRTCDTNWGKLKELPYPLPSLKEQEEIVAYINNVLNQTNNIIADKQQQLEILEEYKKTLIYEYVTGKKEVA